MRAQVWRYILTESGTRRELPDGELSADCVRELLKFDRNKTCGFVFVSYVKLVASTPCVTSANRGP